MIIPPFRKGSNKPMSINSDHILETHGRTELDLTCHIPAEVQDAYHFLDLVFNVRNAFFQTPRGMTLNRYQLLLSEMGRVYNITCISVLDPLSEASKSQQFDALQYIDEDIYHHFNNLMVYCVGLSGSTISELPLEPETCVVRFVDKNLTVLTPFGYLSIIFRVFTPTGVSSSRAREFYLRQLASCNPAVSTRASLLLTDPMFPLRLIPGVLDYVTLVSLARGAQYVNMEDQG